MKSKKLIFLQIMVAISLICTSVYATVSATIDVKPSSSTLERGQTVTVTLSLKDVDSGKKVESISGYINYNKNVIEPINYNSIHKNSDNTVVIGTETLKVEDLTNVNVNSISQASAYVAFNGNPVSKNDARIVIDFDEGITSDVKLLDIDFKVKSDATYGDISDAIVYSMFVVTADSEDSAEITKNVALTIKEKELPENNEQNPDENNPGEQNPADDNNQEEQKPTDDKNPATNGNNNNTTNNTVNNVVNNTTNNTVNNTVNNVVNNTTNNTVNNTAKNIVNKTNTDNTTTGKQIPATGARIILLPIIILGILTYISYNKYSNYKGI